ncbi:porin [Corticimicrobacter populi]|uniref:Porin n=1 Tax=Corticimicrobacter populi TaxID=2175229 RepID=A0A2V1K1Y8_9BURK|nr:porin [Corticimicrobacter populi]PWF23255.1 porin [Corticimicrobacter populi]
MKKTLLAAALTVGFAGVANAETSVTLYGLIDTGIGYTQFKNKNTDIKTKRTGLYDGVQSGNRWGLRGSEDLGDGLRAVFQLESGFTLTDGQQAQGGRLFGRNATIGLANDSWGSLTFGRQTNVSSRFIADSGIASPFGDSFANAAIGETFTSAATVRADDTVVYVSPSFSGFTFAAGYSFGVNGQEWDVTDQDDNSLKLISTGLLYSNGPLGLAATYEQADADNLSNKIKAWNLAASYDFEVVKLHAGFGQERNGTLNGGGNGDRLDEIGALRTRAATTVLANGETVNDVYKANNWSFGVSAPLGAGKLMAGWAQSKAKGDLRDAIVDAKTQNNYAVGYTYDLSKRTNVYAVGSYIKGYAFQDVTATQAIVGLRHRF